MDNSQPPPIPLPSDQNDVGMGLQPVPANTQPTNQKFKLAMILCLTLAIVGMGFFLFLSARNKSDTAVESVVPTPSFSPHIQAQSPVLTLLASPTSTPNKKILSSNFSLVYTNYVNGSWKLYKTDMNGDNAVDTGVNASPDGVGGYPISVSPDGSYLAHLNGGNLEVSSADLSKFTRVFQSPIKDGVINQVVWSPDDSELGVVVYYNFDGQTPFPGKGAIYIINRDGSNVRLVNTIDEPNVSLKGLDSNNKKIYFVNENTGGVLIYSDFMIVDFSGSSPKSNRIDDLSWQGPFANQDSNLKTDASGGLISSDFSKYYLDGYRYDFQTKTKSETTSETRYTFSQVLYIGKQIYYSGGSDKVNSLYSYDTNSDQTTLITSSLPQGADVYSVSPDNNFLLLYKTIAATEKGEYYIMNLGSGQIEKLPDSDDKYFFLGWLNNQ